MLCGEELGLILFHNEKIAYPKTADSGLWIQHSDPKPVMLLVTIRQNDHLTFSLEEFF